MGRVPWPDPTVAGVLLLLWAILGPGRPAPVEAQDHHPTDGGPLVGETFVVSDLDSPRGLRGKVRFQPGDDLAWAAPHFDDSDWKTLSMPDAWGLSGYPDTVVGWYRIRLRFTPESLDDDGRLGIGVGPVSSAYQLYADGQRIGQIAGPPPDMAYDRHGTWPMPQSATEDGEVVLAFRVWRHAAEGSLAGGIRAPIALGHLEDLLLEDLRQEIPSLLLATLFLAFGLYHLLVFRKRHEQISYLWLGLFLVCMATYTLLRSQLHYLVISDFVVGKELEHLTAFVATPLGFVAVLSILGWPLGRFLWGYVCTHPLLGLLVALTPGLELNLKVLAWWPIYTAPAMVYLFAIVIRRARSGDPEARTVAFGSALMALTFGWDQLATNNLVPLLFLTPMGVLGFAGSLALSLSNRFDRVHRQLASLREDLELRVEERTRELATAKVAAEAADLAKGEFLANISHELRTPVHGIHRAASRLRRRTEDLATEASLGSIVTCADQLLSLVDDVLTFSQVESGELGFEAEDIALSSVFRSVHRAFLAKAEAKGLTLDIDLDDALPDRLHTDPARLTQVLVHLMGNAVKFTDQGSVSLAVSCLESAPPGRTRVEGASSDRNSSDRNSSDGNGSDGNGSDENTAADVEGQSPGFPPGATILDIRITDTGPGIDEATMARLFRPFTQGDSSSTRRHGGTGIGLVLSQRLVTRAGGRIEMESHPGEGSTFRILWPCRAAGGKTPSPSLPADPKVELVDKLGPGLPEEAEDGMAEGVEIVAQETRKASPTVRDSDPSSSGGPEAAPGAEAGRTGARILVVDDDEICRTLLVAELEDRHLEVAAVENGQRALDILEKEVFHLVLMDCQMPLVDGYQATRRLRRREAGRRHIPVIAVTAHAMEGDREKCLAAGMDDYLAKPYSEEELAEMLAAWLPPIDTSSSR